MRTKDCSLCLHRRGDKCVSEFVASIVATTDASKALAWCGLRFFQVKQDAAYIARPRQQQRK